MILRERGIYCLPNGRELVVLRSDDEGSVLYGPVICERFEMGEFLVNQAGRLVYQGKFDRLGHFEPERYWAYFRGYSRALKS